MNTVVSLCILHDNSVKGKEENCTICLSNAMCNCFSDSSFPALHSVSVLCATFSHKFLLHPSSSFSVSLMPLSLYYCLSPQIPIPPWQLLYWAALLPSEYYPVPTLLLRALLKFISPLKVSLLFLLIFQGIDNEMLCTSCKWCRRQEKWTNTFNLDLEDVWF